MPSDVTAIMEMLTLEPAAGRQAWRQWRSGIDLDQLEPGCISVLPLLSGRLPDWLGDSSEVDSARDTLLGICRRGWVENQLRYREAVDAVTALRNHSRMSEKKLLRGRARPEARHDVTTTANTTAAHARPAAVAESGPRIGEEGDLGPAHEDVAVFGPVAWALLYAQEKAVRPIESIDLLVPRAQALGASQVLQSAGWHLEAGMPTPEGRILDEFAGIWFRSRSGTALHLAWRLWDVSPELAREHEVFPACRSVEIQGAYVSVIETEELLLEALTRPGSRLVDRKCDVAVLLRNRPVNWIRLQSLVHRFPYSSVRVSEFRARSARLIPPGVLRFPQPSFVRRYLSELWTAYRRVCWAGYQECSFPGFTAYLWRRVSSGRVKLSP